MDLNRKLTRIDAMTIIVQIQRFIFGKPEYYNVKNALLISLLQKENSNLRLRAVAVNIDSIL